MKNVTNNFIFGFGSLVDTKSLKVFLGRDRLPSDDWQFCRLSGYRRIWNVAMDNHVDLPGYKYYIDAETQTRPDAAVTFLNVHTHPESSIEGLLFKVSNDELMHVDRRERNYRRIEVSCNIKYPVNGKVWLYIGLDESVERFKTALLVKKAVISKKYYELVYSAYMSHGQNAALEYLATTDNPGIPLKNLELVKIPNN